MFYICTLLKYIQSNNDFVYVRLDEEGYVPPENTSDSPIQSDNVSTPAPVIQTITLKELSEKTNSEFLKVL